MTAYLQLQNKAGHTILHAAVLANNPVMIRVILDKLLTGREKRIACSKTDSSGLNVWHLAYLKMNMEAIGALPPYEEETFQPRTLSFDVLGIPITWFDRADSRVPFPEGLLYLTPIALLQYALGIFSKKERQEGQLTEEKQKLQQFLGQLANSSAQADSAMLLPRKFTVLNHP